LSDQSLNQAANLIELSIKMLGDYIQDWKEKKVLGQLMHRIWCKTIIR